MKPNISLVLPAYNEEESVEDVVAYVAGILAELTDEFEIIIVDDGSTDNTGYVADLLATRHGWLRVIHNDTNRGAGPSVATGLKAAQYEVVTHNGVDLPFDLQELHKVYPLMEQVDVLIIGKRNRLSYTPYRVLTSWINYLLVHILFEVRYGDLNFVQVYRKSVLDAIEIESSSMFVTPEIIIKARDLGFRVTEIQANVQPRKKGKVKAGNARDVYRTLYDIGRLWMKWRIWQPLSMCIKSKTI